MSDFVSVDISDFISGKVSEFVSGEMWDTEAHVGPTQSHTKI